MHTQATPLVSVVMPVYNAGRYLPPAIDSILAQTFRDFEFILVDDGSTDNSPSILRRYESQDPRIRVISRPNTGIVGALNDGIAVAAGEFIARMDSDDISLPPRFEKQIAYLRRNPDCVVLGSQVMLMDADGAPICPKRDVMFGHERIDEALLDCGWPLVHPAVMMRKAAVEAVGGYREKYQWQEDLDLFLRMAEAGRLENLPDVLLHYRQHFNSICRTRGPEMDRVRQDLYDETRRRRGQPPAPPLGPPRPSKLPPEQHCTWAWSALMAGNVRTARKHALKTIGFRPFSPGSWKLMACAIRGH